MHNKLKSEIGVTVSKNKNQTPNRTSRAKTPSPISISIYLVPATYLSNPNIIGALHQLIKTNLYQKSSKKEHCPKNRNEPLKKYRSWQPVLHKYWCIVYQHKNIWPMLVCGLKHVRFEDTPGVRKRGCGYKGT